MKNRLTPQQTELISQFITVAFILFWLYAAGSKIYNIHKWKSDMGNQVFSENIASILVYVVPAIEIAIAALLIYASTRLLGMGLNLLLMLGFTTYVGLALLNVYSHTPCNCAGLLGINSTWGANFILNLVVTAVAAAGFIFTYKRRRKEGNGMHNNVMHAPLTA